MTKLVTAYRFDKEGYYRSTDSVIPGMLPPDDTLVAPEIMDGYWPKWNGSEWENIKDPESAEDFAEAGIVIDHENHTQYAEHMRDLIRKYAKTSANPGEYVLKQDPATNDLSVYRVPDSTEAEIALQNAEKADDELAASIEDLKDRMVCAILANDAEWIAELQKEYSDLMGL